MFLANNGSYRIFFCSIWLFFLFICFIFSIPCSDIINIFLLKKCWWLSACLIFGVKSRVRLQLLTRKQSYEMFYFRYLLENHCRFICGNIKESKGISISSLFKCSFETIGKIKCRERRSFFKAKPDYCWELIFEVIFSASSRIIVWKQYFDNIYTFAHILS